MNPARRTLVVAAIVIVAAIVSTTLAQDRLIALIPLKNLLKNVFAVDRAANAEFAFWIGLPWYVKPFIGILSDAFPLFGRRRQSYMILGGLVASIGWFATTITSQDYSQLLISLLFVNTAMVVTSTVVGGYMVEVAQADGGSGRLTAVRNFAEQMTFVIAGPAGGLLASFAFAWTAVVCGGIAFLIVPVAVWVLQEPKQPAVPAALRLRDARAQLREIAKAKSMWAAAGLAGLFYFAPGLSTALFYLQQNDLHMSTETQGYLTFLSGVFGVLAAVLYGGYASRRLTLKTLLVGGLLLGTLANLGYLFYSTRHAPFIESFNGFAYTLAEVAMMHLAVRATPAGCEAFGFSLLMSVRNFCLFGGDWVGSKLMDQYHVSFDSLVLINAGTSLLAVPAVLLLPVALVRVRDTIGGARTSL